MAKARKWRPAKVSVKHAKYNSTVKGSGIVERVVLVL